jgi:hypothetical protein
VHRWRSITGRWNEEKKAKIGTTGLKEQNHWHKVCFTSNPQKYCMRFPLGLLGDRGIKVAKEDSPPEPVSGRSTVVGSCNGSCV